MPLVQADPDQALSRQQPAVGLVHHLGRRRQLTSTAYPARLAAHGVIGSMSRLGSGRDLAVMETFIALKRECVRK